METSIQDRVTQLKEIFAPIPDWESRYSKMIKLGKEMESYPAEGKEDKYLIKGCQSKVWLYPDFKDGKLHLFADSDSVLVKGIVSLLVYVYSGQEPKEILKNPADFLKDLGITEHLSMNRNNGLVSMLKQIQLYAQVLDLQQKMKS
jgi:cysteine desulfuration protein SufE